MLLQAGDTVTFSLLKRPRRGIIPQEVAGAGTVDTEVTAAQDKVNTMHAAVWFPPDLSQEE